jgi:creatinine amidohydrolase/Fe(II)-dependent formamide hydrolase-like protein
MMLHLGPSIARMEKAVADGAADRPGPLTRDPKATTGLVSPSGVFGDTRLATRAKGEAVVEGFVADILAEIDTLSRRPLPPGAPRSPLDAGR